MQTLQDELNYEVHYRIIDGQHFVPQHRVLIVESREETEFSDLQLPEKGAVKLSAIFQMEVKSRKHLIPQEQG